MSHTTGVVLYGKEGVDLMYGSYADDRIYGYGGADRLYGRDGQDSLYGGAADDRLYGEAGSDVLEGGAGADYLDGGADAYDRASYLASPAGVSVSLFANVAYGGDAQGDTFSGIEDIQGSLYGDYLYGDNNANRLIGIDGDDWLKGYGGEDFLYGGRQNDWLFGMADNDVMRGDSGNDRLNGGAGRDVLYGGDGAGGSDGADTFSWTSTAETGLTLETMDVVMDFNRAQGDMIDLSGIDADLSEPGDQAFHYIGLVTAFSGDPGEIRCYHFNGDTYLALQTDTDLEAEGVIRLEGTHYPDDDWFVL